MNGNSLIVYNFISDTVFECLYLSNEEEQRDEVNMLFSRARARAQNGIVVCCIPGDWVDKDIKEISAGCCENIRKALKW